jgi:agmatinase
MTLRNSVLAVAIAALCLPLSAPVLAAQSKKKDAAVDVPKPDPTVQIPADVQSKVQALPKEKLEFVTSGKAARFMPTKALLERFRTSTPQEIEAMIDAMMSVVEQSKYHDGTDPGSIPLNTESESFNSWKVKRPLNLDPKREPGPINLSPSRRKI